MSYSISTLLTRNLQDVFGENDRAIKAITVNKRRMCFVIRFQVVNR